MSIEYKSIKAAVMGIEDRTVTGVFCVHGNIDSGDGWYSRDRSHPGVFGDFKVGSGGAGAARDRVQFLWQHNSYELPTAKIEKIFEIGKAELPAAVLLYAPEATGGVAVTRTYDDDEFSERVLKKIKNGMLKEMSYAYEVTRYDIEEPKDGGLRIRNIYEADLYDISDVNWGMNPATSADGSKGKPLHAEAQAARAAVQSYIKRLESLHALRVVKEGRRFSSATVKEIEEAIEGLKTSTDRLQKLIAVSDDTEDDGKTQRRKTQDVYQEWQSMQARLRTLGVTTT